jgi:hypothetical protein
MMFSKVEMTDTILIQHKGYLTSLHPIESKQGSLSKRIFVN